MCYRKIVSTVCFFLIFSFRITAAGTGESPSDGPPGPEAGSSNYLTIAALMLKDGHFDRAENILEAIDPDDGLTDKSRYYTLRGILRMYQDNHAQALEDLERALDYGAADPLIPLYLTFGYYKTGDYESAERSSRDIADIDAYPDFLFIRARSLQLSGRPRQAYEVIRHAVQLYPDNPDIYSIGPSILLDLGLYAEAEAAGRDYIALTGNTAEAFLLVGELFRQEGALRETVSVFEKGRLYHPHNADICRLLAESYLALGSRRVAADLIARAARIDRIHASRAAEVYLGLGDYNRALYFNSLVPDERERSIQRCIIHIRNGEYEKAARQAEELEQYDLSDHPYILYSLAYMYYNLQDFDRALRIIEYIPPGSFEDELREIKKAINTSL